MPDQPYQKLDVDRRRSVAEAAALIHDAGFREKGRLLYDCIERGTIFTDPNMSPANGARAGDGRIRLGPDVPMTKGSPPASLGRGDRALLILAALLVNLADQAMGHSRLQALADEMAFGTALRRRPAELVPGADAAKRKEIDATGKLIEDFAGRERDEEVKRTPPSKPQGPKDKIKVELKVSLPQFGVEYAAPVEAVATPAELPEPWADRAPEIRGRRG